MGRYRKNFSPVFAIVAGWGGRSNKYVFSTHNAWKVNGWVPQKVTFFGIGKIPFSKPPYFWGSQPFLFRGVSVYLLTHFLGGGFNFYFIFTPNLGKWSNLTSIFFKGVETTNQFWEWEFTGVVRKTSKKIQKPGPKIALAPRIVSAVSAARRVPLPTVQRWTCWAWPGIVSTRCRSVQPWRWQPGSIWEWYMYPPWN